MVWILLETIYCPCGYERCICHFTKWQIHPFISKGTIYPASTKHWSNFGSTLACCLRRQSNIDPILVQCLVFAVYVLSQLDKGPAHKIMISKLIIILAIFFSKGTFTPYPAKLIYWNFHPLEVASRYHDPQYYSYLFYLSTNICKSWCLDPPFLPNNSDLVDL